MELTMQEKKENRDIIIDTQDYAVVLGMQAFISETASGEPLLVLRLDTDDAKRVLWSFNQENFHVFLKSMLHQSEIFGENNAEKSEI